MQNTKKTLKAHSISNSIIPSLLKYEHFNFNKTKQCANFQHILPLRKRQMSRYIKQENNENGEFI